MYTYIFKIIHTEYLKGIFGVFSNTIKQFSGNTDLESYKFNSIWLYLPGDSIRSHRIRAQYLKTDSISEANYKSRLSFVLLPNWI